MLPPVPRSTRPTARATTGSKPDRKAHRYGVITSKAHALRALASAIAGFHNMRSVHSASGSRDGHVPGAVLPGAVPGRQRTGAQQNLRPSTLQDHDDSSTGRDSVANTGRGPFGTKLRARQGGILSNQECRSCAARQHRRVTCIGIPCSSPVARLQQSPDTVGHHRAQSAEGTCDSQRPVVALGGLSRAGSRTVANATSCALPALGAGPRLTQRDERTRSHANKRPERKTVGKNGHFTSQMRGRWGGPIRSHSSRSLSSSSSRGTMKPRAGEPILKSVLSSALRGSRRNQADAMRSQSENAVAAARTGRRSVSKASSVTSSTASTRASSLPRRHRPRDADVPLLFTRTDTDSLAQWERYISLYTSAGASKWKKQRPQMPFGGVRQGHDTTSLADRARSTAQHHVSSW